MGGEMGGWMDGERNRERKEREEREERERGGEERRGRERERERGRERERERVNKNRRSGLLNMTRGCRAGGKEGMVTDDWREHPPAQFGCSTYGVSKVTLNIVTPQKDARTVGWGDTRKGMTFL